MRGSSSMDVTDVTEDPTAWGGARRVVFSRSPPVVSSGTTGLARFRSVSAHNMNNAGVNENKFAKDRRAYGAYGEVATGLEIKR